jgi:hypothetical protein
MPWEQTGSGYKTSRGGFVKNPAQYEKLRGKGMSKERAARIVNKELRMKDPIEIMKADALWRRDDEDIEKGIFGGLAQGLKRTQAIGPMQRGTQAGFNAGTAIRSAGSKVAGAFRRTGGQVKAGAQTAHGPLPAAAPTATKVGQQAARAPGRLVAAVKERPKTAIGIGAASAGLAGGGAYTAGRTHKKRTGRP